MDKCTIIVEYARNIWMSGFELKQPLGFNLL